MQRTSRHSGIYCKIRSLVPLGSILNEFPVNDRETKNFTVAASWMQSRIRPSAPPQQHSEQTQTKAQHTTAASTPQQQQAMDAPAAAPFANGLQSVAERAPDGQPMLQDEELARSFPGVSLVLGDGCDLGAGALFITTRRVVWLSGADTRVGCSVEFTQISLHAISSDTAHFPRPCIYMQLDAPEREAGDGEDEDAAPEVRLAPADAGSRTFL